MNQIDTLIELQHIDTQLLEIKELLGDLPKKVEELKNEETRLKSELETDRARHMEIDLKVSKTDLNLADIQGKIDGLKEQLFKVANNRQFDALTHEIDHLKAGRDTLETEDLVLLEEKDVLDEKIKTEEVGLASLSGELGTKLASLEKQLTESAKEKASLENERLEKIKDIDDTTLRRYNRILEARDGVAVVPLQGTACSGCGNSLTLQVAAEIKAKQTVHACVICSRIVFYDKNA